jgi:Domain of unknown function (DUF4145)
MDLVFRTQGPIARADGTTGSNWSVFRCTTCTEAVLAKGPDNNANPSAAVVALFPSAKEAHEDIPEPARRFLQQAFETLHAPDAAALMAGSAVDAMLKELGLSKGSVYDRIDQAVKSNLLTRDMGDWAHEVRLNANRPRHADAENPHVSSEEATQSVEFADALANFLFILKAKIQRGIEGAKQASGS